MPDKDLILFEALTGSTVDPQTGILTGCSVLTIGVAKGHNVLVDLQTLKDVKACAAKFKGGVKVKMNHWSGADSIVGALRSFRIEGEQLKADLHLLKSHTQFETVLELAAEMPDQFGLSPSFTGQDEIKGGLQYARCSELYSIDIVDQPAANPTGLFSTATTQNPMSTPNTTPAAPAAAAAPAAPDFSATIAALTTQLSELTAKITRLEAAAPAPDPEKKALSEVTLGEFKTLIAAETARQFAAVGLPIGGSAPGGPAPAPAAPAAPVKKNFAAIVADNVTAGKSKAEAIRLAIKSNPAEYAEARKLNQLATL